MVTARRTAGETGRLGTEIYERDIRHKVADAHDGEYIAIDVDTGHWAIADSQIGAPRELRVRHPEAINVLLLRIGYRAVASIGGGPPARDR